MADTWEFVPGSTAGAYTDDLIFEVDWENKELQKILGQTLIAGEENSQYIRFQMGRYYDGIDLSEKQIYIVFSLEKSYFGKTLAVSIERSAENIRFGWIVPKTACAVNGTLEFYLKFQDLGYVLKTKSTKVQVEESKEESDLIPEPTRAKASQRQRAQYQRRPTSCRGRRQPYHPQRARQDPRQSQSRARKNTQGRRRSITAPR